MDLRTKSINLIKTKISSLSSKDIEDLEKGIYNWCIDYAIEHRIIKNWGNPIFKRLYIEKLRHIVTNLDKSSYIGNINLEIRLLDKEFLPHEVSYMKPENLYPDQWSSTIEKHIKKFEYAYETKNLTTTDQFRCGKCKRRECTFYTQQCRSADESETIFIRCVNCGNQWRQ
jgi:transcription elongation factor S-II